MRILIAYGTNSGGTLVTAECMKDVFERHQHIVDLIRADLVDPDSFNTYDLIILGSCTWEVVTPQHRFEGALQEHVLSLKNKLKGKTYPDKKFAVYALGDSSYTSFCSAANHLVALVRQLKGQLIGEVLRIDKFFYKLNENRSTVSGWTQKLCTQLIRQT